MNSTLSPNCTLVELKFAFNELLTILFETPNCTLVELKLAKAPADSKKTVSSKLYLSGIEIYIDRPALHQGQGLQIVP